MYVCMYVCIYMYMYIYIYIYIYIQLVRDCEEGWEHVTSLNAIEDAYIVVVRGDT
jgi:hypothetical protein